MFCSHNIPRDRFSKGLDYYFLGGEVKGTQPKVSPTRYTFTACGCEPAAPGSWISQCDGGSLQGPWQTAPFRWYVFFLF